MANNWTGFGKTQKKHKYNSAAKKVVDTDGKISRVSKLELYAKAMFEFAKFNFDYQKTFVLQDGFVLPTDCYCFSKKGQLVKGIRPIKCIIDFVFENNGKILIVDTKGFQTPENALKIKLLFAHLLGQKKPFQIIFLQNQLEVRRFTEWYQAGCKNFFNQKE